VLIVFTNIHLLKYTCLKVLTFLLSKSEVNILSDVIIIGGGAAGLMAAYSASISGHKVTIIERNEKCGKKIYITGKGRCNLTNACDYEDFFDHVVTNSKFMYSPFYSFTNTQVIDLFSKELNMPVKIERGERAFPVSDKASDVTKALLNALKKFNVKIIYNTIVKELIIENNSVKGVITNTESLFCDYVIIATGGKSYPSTGSDGSGYNLAKDAGHSVTPLYPALVPMNTLEKWPLNLQGLALKNVRVTFSQKNKTLYTGMGEMLFTHFGVSGPLVITASSYLSKLIHSDKAYNNDICMTIDLKPALSIPELEDRILRDFNLRNNQQFKNSLNKLLPSKIIPEIVEMSGIKPEKMVNMVTKEERHNLAVLIKELVIHIKDFRGFGEAIITQGGVNVKEINPSTMESKICKGLYFAGEIIDIDAVTGGYNLQIAWSTGYLAGISIEQ